MPPLPGVGEEVTGKVSRVVGYGVFLDLDGGKGRALLHVDEVAVKDEDAGREPNVRALFKEGDELAVRPCACLGRRCLFRRPISGLHPWPLRRVRPCLYLLDMESAHAP